MPSVCVPNSHPAAAVVSANKTGTEIIAGEVHDNTLDDYYVCGSKPTNSLDGIRSGPLATFVLHSTLRSVPFRIKIPTLLSACRQNEK